jgi:hypothetical protein
MEKVLGLLKELLEVQTLQVRLGSELQECLSAEEAAAAGFSLAELNAIIARKDQLINRFMTLEKNRRRSAEQVAFLIGFDIRGQNVSVSALAAALEAYRVRVQNSLPAHVAEHAESDLRWYLEETAQQLPNYKKLARRIQRNKAIIGRTLMNVNRSVQFFEQAFRVSDLFYTQSGKQARVRFGGQLPTQINVRA